MDRYQLPIVRVRIDYASFLSRICRLHERRRQTNKVPQRTFIVYISSLHAQKKREREAREPIELDGLAEQLKVICSCLGKENMYARSTTYVVRRALLELFSCKLTTLLREVCHIFTAQNVRVFYYLFHVAY